MKSRSSRRMFGLCVALLISASLASSPPANAEQDPFPGVADGAEIPGTRVSGAPGDSEATFYASSAYLSHTCPTGSGRGIGVDLAFTSDRSKHVRYVYCVKTWRPTETIDAEAKYRSDLAAAQAASMALMHSSTDPPAPITACSASYSLLYLRSSAAAW